MPEFAPVTSATRWASGAPSGDVAVLMAREKQARVRTRDASISRRYGRGPRLQTGAVLQPPGVRRTVPVGALSNLELFVEARPLLRERRALRAMERHLEDAEPEQSALDPDRRHVRDPDLLEQLVLRQLADLGRGASLHHLGQHRRRRLADGAAATRELDLVDRLPVVTEG